MSKNIFAKLKSMDFNAIQAQRLALTAPPETPTTGQKRSIPNELEKENSQPPRRGSNPFSFNSGPTNPLPSLANMNVLSTMRQYLSTKGASASETEEVMRFINEPPPVREAMLYTELVIARSRSESAVKNQAWIPENDKELGDNLKQYAIAINLTPTLSGYSSKYTAPILRQLVYTLRWNVPEDIMDNMAHRSALDTFIRYHLTQSRSNVKKKIIKSLAEDSPQDTYTLTSSLVEGTDIKITLPLVYRAALWRAVLEELDPKKKGSSDQYWAEVDKKIKWVNEEAKRSEAKTRFLLEEIYKNDQELYGSSSEIDVMGNILKGKTLQAPTNIEKNIEDAIRSSATSKGKRSEPDPEVDPLLYGPIGITPNSISLPPVASTSQPSVPSTPAAGSERNEDDRDIGFDRSFNTGASSDAFSEG